MATLYITVGLPGSGKTYLARGWVAQDPVRRARVNRDDLRRMMHGSTWLDRSKDNRGTEPAVRAARDALIRRWLHLGFDVVCDDTNLHDGVRAGLQQVATRAKARFEIWDLTHTPLQVCIERDAMRTMEADGREPIGEKKITEMYERFLVGRIAD